MQMFNAEVTGITHDKIRPRISQTAKSLWGTYIVLTIMLFALFGTRSYEYFRCIVPCIFHNIDRRLLFGGQWGGYMGVIVIC